MVYVYGEHKGGIMEVLHHFIEMIRVFRNKDLFITLNLYDLHHYMKYVPDIGEQICISLENYFYTEAYQGKSVHAYYNINKYEDIKNLNFHDFEKLVKQLNLKNITTFIVNPKSS